MLVAMSSELADFVDGVPGRFVPEEMRGQLVEAEHLTRYAWAARHAAGRRVLDAGSGAGYGSLQLAAAGAAEVVGIDVAPEVVAAAEAAAPDRVRFEVGDVRSLDFDDAGFDLITCFEVIEHVDEQAAVLAEFARVLAPDGLLLISAPNRDVNVPGNPHHVHEPTPAELEQLLGAHWPHVRMLQQHNYLASTILAEAGEPEPMEPLDGVDLRRLVGKAAGDEVYAIAIASAAPIPEPAQLVTLASPVEVRQWLERYEEQQTILQGQLNLLEVAKQRDADRAEALERLAEAERELAEQPALRRHLDELRKSTTALQSRINELEFERGELADRAARADRAEATLDDVVHSPSWRLTAPLRAAKRLLRGRG